MKKRYLSAAFSESGGFKRKSIFRLAALVICIAVLIGAFCGCGGKNEPSETPAPAKTSVPTETPAPTDVPETPAPTPAPLAYTLDYHRATPLLERAVGEQAVEGARMVIDAFVAGETSVKFGFDSYDPAFALNTMFAVRSMCPPFTAFAECNDYRDFDAETGTLKWKIINVEPEKLGEKLQIFESTAKDFMSALCEDDNDIERALLLYSRLTAHAEYDYEVFDDAQNISEDEYNYRTSAYAVMCDGMGICYSFSEAMTFICAQAGVDCISVNCINESIAHEWNIIKLGGKYYYCDATWDVGGTFNYFGMTTEERVENSGGIKAEDMTTLSTHPEELLDGAIPADTRFAVLRAHTTSMPVTVEIDRATDEAIFTIVDESFRISCAE